MERQRLTSGTEFWTRFIYMVSACGAFASLVVLGYLLLLLRMPAEQVKGLALFVGLVFVLATPLSVWIYKRMVAPISCWLDARTRSDNSSEAPLDDGRKAFEAVVNLPGRLVAVAFLLFVVPASLVAFAMFARFEEFRLYHFSLMVVSIFAGGALTSIIEGAVLKRWLAEARAELALAVSSPMQRSELTSPLSLSTKLQVVISACTLVPVIFAALIGYTRSTIPVEEFANALQSDLARGAVAAYRYQGALGLAQVAQTDLALALEAQVVVLDRTTGAIIGDAAGGLTALEIERIRDSRAEFGSGSQLRADNLYVWRNTHDGSHAIVISSPRVGLVGDPRDLAAEFVGILVACLLLGLGVGWLIAQDVGGATQRLGHAADRMASGDLRRIDVLESEDELGVLARAFDAMASSLRSSVGDVAESADGIEEASSNLSGVAGEMHTAAEAQGRDVKLVVEAMEEVESQASEIARSSDELRNLVGESTSSILELGASGDQLNVTAGSLGDRVEEVSSTIEQTVRSVRHVGRETGALVEAASDTSSSMSEMATAMKHVDNTAAETAQLSEQVVAASEFGHDKVLATIEGIESIRDATSTAQSVILRLDSRAQEIGGIVDVISDVADETNLLALNAAIIAAQAGDQGRGFAIVAGQIKGLANRVLASTQEISGLISSVQQESQSAIDAMEEGTRSVAEGVERSSEAGKSLEEITRISRDSGLRIREIVESVREQTKAAVHVVDLMDRVRTGVETIQDASSEQERGNELVLESTQTMRDVAQQLHMTTAEQAAGVARIRESVTGVQQQMESINGALQEQTRSTNHVVGFLEEVSSRSMANERAARLMGESTEALSEQAHRLRAGMGRFQRS